MAIRIECVNKADRYNPHKHILNIGGRNADGTGWKLSEADAIQGIKDGKWSFYVSVNGRSVPVLIARSSYGNEYLKTADDDYRPDNLLSLPECPRTAISGRA